MRVGQYGRTATTLGVLAATLAILPVRVAPIAGPAVSVAFADEGRGDGGRGDRGRDGGGRDGGGRDGGGRDGGGRDGGGRDGGGRDAARNDDRGGDRDRGGGRGEDDDDRGGSDRGGSDRGGSDRGGSDRGGSGEGGDGPRGDGDGEHRGSDGRGAGADRSGRGRTEGPEQRGRGREDGGGRNQPREQGVEAGTAPRTTEAIGRSAAGDGAPAGQGDAGASGAGVGVGAPAGGGDGGPVKAVRVERDGAGLRIFYSNRVRERIAAGRYEMQDAEGRTVIDREATPADLDRVRENVRRSGLPAASENALPEGSEVESLAVTPGGLSVRYRAGWTENLAEGRYRLADPDGNTVVERAATPEDRNRLLALAGG